MDDISIMIGQDLKLDVSGMGDVFLKIECVISEGCLRLCPGDAHRLKKLFPPVHSPDPFTPTARNGFDENWISQIIGGLQSALFVVQRKFPPGDHRDRSPGHVRSRRELSTHDFQRFPGGPNEDDPFFLARSSKIRVFR